MIQNSFDDPNSMKDNDVWGLLDLPNNLNGLVAKGFSKLKGIREKMLGDLKLVWLLSVLLI